jgi:hypothetical protein
MLSWQLARWWCADLGHICKCYFVCACVRARMCVRNKKHKFRPLGIPIRAAGEPAYSNGCGPLPRKGGHLDTVYDWLCVVQECGLLAL